MGDKGPYSKVILFIMFQEGFISLHKKIPWLGLGYGIVKDSNADLTIGNWKSKKGP